MPLEEEADARKARLLALRRKKQGRPNGVVHGEEPVLSTRNFDLETRTLRKRTRDDDEDMEDTVEKNIAGLAEHIVAEDEGKRAQELDLTNIAPKRPNWDLKRELERKTAKLERKTQEAIHALIRQRLAAQKGQTDDIIGVIRAREEAEQNEDLSDEDEDI
ncbi:mRNA splicing factor [Phellopilus nigrolimitatus]|nr:mRNA splicing factor [Phellopilus nigrolimitatus]